MLIAACGGPSETKKDTAQNNKPIEITDVTALSFGTGSWQLYY